MSTQSTDSRRNNVMRVLSVAEQVVSTSPVLPTEVTVMDNCRGSFSLDLYFHRAPESLRTFAAAFGAEAVSRPHLSGEGRTYMSATVVVDGVQVHAWSLADGVATSGAADAAVAA